MPNLDEDINECIEKAVKKILAGHKTEDLTTVVYLA
jgi:hypothetical protein